MRTHDEEPGPRYVSARSGREPFWRSVASQVVAGLIIAAVIYVVGIAGGYFTVPERWLALLLTVILLCGGVVAVLAITAATGELRRRFPGARGFWYVAGMIVALLVLLVPVVFSLVDFYRSL